MNDIFTAAHSYQFKGIINNNNSNIEDTVGENPADSGACSFL